MFGKQDAEHEHPGGDVPHRHSERDELATHGTGEGSSREEEGRTVQLREEQLQARTTPVEAGRVQIGKEVVSEERTLEVPVTREEAVIERRPVERRPTDEPIGEGEDQTIRVPLREERVEVEKRPVVYEEVEVGKRRVQETQPVSDTVRREEARVESQGEVEVRGTDQPPRP